MKDYYYLLGLGPDANEAQIRMAFKELSIKFHPDRNGGDKFFEEHFKEIQEAYTVLSDPEKRRHYDRSLLSEEAAEQEVKEETPPPPPPTNPSVGARPPLIQELSTSKTRASAGELITLSWRVSNADYLHLSQVGEIAPQGSKTLRLPAFAGQDFIIFTLLARNTLLNQTAERQLLIQNKDASPKMPQAEGQQSSPLRLPSRAQAPYEEDEEGSSPHGKRPKPQSRGRGAGISDRDAYAFFLIFMLLMLIVVIIFAVWQLNATKR